MNMSKVGGMGHQPKPTAEVQKRSSNICEKNFTQIDKNRRTRDRDSI